MSNRKALIAEKPTATAPALKVMVCHYFHYKPHLSSRSNSRITAGRNLPNEAQAFLLKGKKD